jgi:hypothetical protein
MKFAVIALAALAPVMALAQPATNPDQHYFEDAAQQTVSELTRALISQRATIAKLQDESAKLRAEMAKDRTPATPTATDAPK